MIQALDCPSLTTWAAGQHHGTVFSYRDGVFEMCSGAAILGHAGPVIVQLFIFMVARQGLPTRR